MFSSIVATVYEITCVKQILPKKKNLTSISNNNKPIIVLFVLLPLEAAFHQFNTLLLITFDPIARLRSNFFQTECNHKAQPPKGFSSLQIVAVVHGKQKKTKFWASGARKMSWWGTFL